MSFDKQHEVTQADRDAAAALRRDNGFSYGGMTAVAMQIGQFDDHSFVQAFAKHRLAALKASSRQEERLREGLAAVTDLFALPGENMVERFERLAAMFRKDTGFLAPGKDQPMGGADQPDVDQLRAIYDGWYQAKIDRARAALEPPHAKDAADA